MQKCCPKTKLEGRFQWGKNAQQLFYIFYDFPETISGGDCMKKILSVLLCLTLVLSAFAPSAQAEERVELDVWGCQLGWPD